MRWYTRVGSETAANGGSLPRATTYIAVAAAKAARFGSRVLRAGSGTTLPGLVAERIDPAVIAELSAALPDGVIVVTGTNGKTTTAKMLTEILTAGGKRVLTNESGSNLTRGVASTLVQASRGLGLRIDADVAVFEIDEATMATAMPRLQPSLVVVTNLFRDQLDRYGELDKTAAIIGDSLRQVEGVSVLLNADDPLVASLAKDVRGRVAYFGVEDPAVGTATSTAAMDSKDCVVCGHEYVYAARYFGHLGIWHCPSCGATRPAPSHSASHVALSPHSSSFVYGGRTSFEVTLGLPGLYNVYNALAAAALAEEVGVAAEAIVSALSAFSAAFGRMERVTVDHTPAMLLLIKNPTGANQSLAAVFSDDRPKTIVFALNDNFADGTDVSWIWDVEFEAFDLPSSRFVASGIRADDAAVRLKYAGLPPDRLEVVHDPVDACRRAAQLAAAGEEISVLPTYTAMMEIRGAYAPQGDALAGLGAATKRGL
jgi:lipid II isoglutaminyl synthase (glutamine-hydrolysing)